ncbi:glycosyltransferase family 2 protein [Gracilibacillus kekensis]|uniref:Glycosyltransferase, GT2 family n=1 Tax=Gracilibacillus kekensis TaxID=1027249 RepID=A0A1M7L0B3_9BACI|nr:glycosyltransferase family 2 protein [Gracilibacillus kekensis]SHM70921.1 Glycosyltransferase, GT2 family [Gracilibacillus kekensis]
MSQEKVSIIVTTYNRKVALAELLAALTEQTYQNFDVIIINDAGERVEDVIDLYPELSVKLINLSENHYHVYARNKGLEKATGELIMLMDDDDLPLPTHLEKMVNEIEGYDLVYSDVEIVNYHETKEKRIPLDYYLFAYTFDIAAMRKFSTYVPSGSLYRRSLHNEVGEFDETVRNYWDWDFFLRVAKNHRIKRVPTASVLYEFSESGNNQSKKLDNMRFYLDRLSEKHQLGNLPTKNFHLLLEEPDLKQREAESKRLWTGEMPQSRLQI